MTTSPNSSVTIEELFDMPPDIIGPEAFQVWTALLYNRINYFGWTSALGDRDDSEMRELSERFFNHHSYLQLGQEKIYTQFPSKTFFFARQVVPTLYVRGAIWSNGVLWQEIDERRGRDLFLMMNELTMKAFEYSNPSFSDTQRIIDLRDYG